MLLLKKKTWIILLLDNNYDALWKSIELTFMDKMCGDMCIEKIALLNSEHDDITLISHHALRS